MPRFAVLIMLGLAACAAGDASEEAGLGSGEMQGWRSASGKAPSRAEFAAMVAACQDGVAKRASATQLDSCLADLGLRRAP